MSGTKRISALTELASTSVAGEDILAIVDMSQASVADKTKHTKVSSLLGSAASDSKPKVSFKTVAAFVADNNSLVGYAGSGAKFELAEGDIFEAEGLPFSVRATGAGDNDIATAGGFKADAKRFGAGYDLRQFGVTEGSGAATANVAKVQAAIDKGNADGVRTVLTCPFNIYADDELFIKTHVVGAYLTFNFVPTASDKACCNVGTKDGAYLVRTGGWVGCVVDATGTTQTGTVGFSIGHGARACFINGNCRAIMNNNGGAGSTTIDYGHIGFQMLGVRPDLVTTLQGAYQNDIQGSCFNARRAFYANTEGYGEGGFAPEMNANTIKVTAFSCRTNAGYVGEGAQENLIQLRADTFINQIGQGTTMNIVEVRGSYNRIEVDEEVGTLADTQHTVAFEGDNARYNEVIYQTQNVVTARVVDNTTGSAVGKNVSRFIGRPNSMLGGDLFCASGYSVAASGSTTTHSSVVIDRRAVLVKVVAENGVTPTTYTRLYFAKNGSIDSTNRVTWDNTDAAGTRKEKIVDSTASGTIDSRFLYVDGDVVDIRIDQDASGGQQVRWTAYFKCLE